MKLIANIPRMLNDLMPLDKNTFLLAADDVIYRVDIKGNDITLSEIFRWSGTNVLSISAYKDIIVAGTDKGVLILKEGKISPVWIGYPSIVFAGNFYENIDIVCLGKPPYKISRIIDLYAFSSKEVIEKSLRSLRGMEEEIVYFATNMGPIDKFAFYRIRDLAVKVDIDADGYEELLLITPNDEPTLYIVDFSGGQIDSKKFPLPTFVRNPVRLGFSDIDFDGEKEIYVVSMKSDYEALISVILIDTQLQDEVFIKTIAVAKLDIRDFMREQISDDGIFYIFGGEFDNDGLPEIIALWEEPVGEVGFVSKIWPLKLSLMGKTIFVKDAFIKDIAVKDVFPYDIDGDGANELIIFTESGFSIYKVLIKGKRIKLEKMFEFKTPLFIARLNQIDQYLVLSGPIMEDTDNLWSTLLYSTDKREIKYILLSKPIMRTFTLDNMYMLLTEDNKLILLSKEKNRIIEGIRDAILINDTLYLLKEQQIIESKIDTDKLELKTISKQSLNFLPYIFVETRNSKLIIIGEEKDKPVLVHYPENKKEDLPLKIEDIKKASLLPLDNDNVLIVLKNDTINVQVREKKVQKIKCDGDFVIEDFNGDKYPEILYTRGGEFYCFSLINMTETRLVLDNITSIAVKKEAEKKFIVAFKNNWVAEYSFEEVNTAETVQ